MRLWETQLNGGRGWASGNEVMKNKLSSILGYFPPIYCLILNYDNKHCLQYNIFIRTYKRVNARQWELLRCFKSFWPRLKLDTERRRVQAAEKGYLNQGSYTYFTKKFKGFSRAFQGLFKDQIMFFKHIIQTSSTEVTLGFSSRLIFVGLNYWKILLFLIF